MSRSLPGVSGRFRDGTAIVASGQYTDDLTKKNGVWKLQKRIQTIDPCFKA